MNKYGSFLITHVQSFAMHLLEAVAFLHSLNLAHIGLKLENLLLVSSEDVQVPSEKYDSTRSSSTSPSTSIDSGGDKSLFPKPKYADIKLINFGGATFERDHHMSLNNIRQYRTSVVILECG